MSEKQRFDPEAFKQNLRVESRSNPEGLKSEIHKALKNYPDHRTTILTLVDQVSNESTPSILASGRRDVV